METVQTTGTAPPPDPSREGNAEALRQQRPTEVGAHGVTRPTFGETELAGLYQQLGVTGHPILKLPTVEQARALVSTPQGRAQFIKQLQARQLRIRMSLPWERTLNAEGDPLNWTFEAETWSDTDRVLRGAQNGGVDGSKLRVDGQGGERSSQRAERHQEQEAEEIATYIVGIFGGNRATKTWYAIKRACEAAVLFPGGKIAICSESETASVATVQALVWHYLRRHYEHLNGKRHSVTAINYTQKNGFSERKIVLPNGTEIYFLTYNQEAGDYEGWEFGAPIDVYEARLKQLREALADASGAKDAAFLPIDLRAWRAQGRDWTPNIGVVADESMPLSWLKMFSRRVKFRHARLLWPFTPVRGITPAIKEMVGASARTLESRPSELLPGQNFPDLPAGHMPYIRQCSMTGAKAIYFFTLFNKFGPSSTRTYYDEIKVLCAGKTNEYVERVAYGFARDSVSRAFPNFGPRNVVRRDQIPAHGTNYLFMDPHGTRNFPMIWIRVCPTRPDSLYIYREWPDVPTYGEWAVPTERETSDTSVKGWDGDSGPAQTGLGWGVVQYKLEIKRQEKINVPAELTKIEDGRSRMESELERVLARVPDQYHRARIRQALRSGENLSEVYEIIAARFGDPRGLHNTHVSEQGGITLFDDFLKEQVDEVTKQVVPPMELDDAATSRRANAEEADEGITKVNELLGCPSREAVPVFHQPHLFVSEECRNVIWMLENYTGRSGGKGASKDFKDLVSYAVVSDLEHVENANFRGRAGKGF